MERTSVSTLLFITLLQVCHQQQVPSWFSANVIKDGDYSPKPISEIFSTDSPFSTSNPIVVVPSSTSQTFGPFSSTTEESLTSSSLMAGSGNMAVMPLPQSSTIQPVSTMSTTTFSTTSSTPTPTPVTSRSTEITSTTQQPFYAPGLFTNFPQNTPPNFLQGIPNFPWNVAPNFSQSIANFPQNLPSSFQQSIPNFQRNFSLPFYNQDIFFPTDPTFRPIQSTPQPIASTPQGFQPQVTQNQQTQTTPPQPNYFVIYSPGPQTILSGPPATNQQPTTTNQQFPINQQPPSTTNAPVTTERPTTRSPCDTASAANTPQSINLSTVPPTAANFPRATSTQNVLMQPSGQLFPGANGSLFPGANGPLVPGANRPLVPGADGSLFPGANGPLVTGANGPLVPGANRPLVPGADGSLFPGANGPLVTGANGPLVPGANGLVGTGPNGQVIQAGVAPNVKSFKIRLISPTGSLTKLKFVGPSTTTKRPTTTRRPAPAKKDKRLNRNTYDDCMKGCPNSRRPVCATPLGERPINADKLRGFPSVCHMACHNSYNKNHYERVIEGRCGKLRTQIRLYGTDKKVKKDDLNKAQYAIVNDNNTNFLQLTSFSANK